MNDTITHYIMYAATLMYLAYITMYIFKNITKQQNSMVGLVFSVDIFRYTSMFLSFMLTMYFGTEWGIEKINARPMEPVETIMAFSLVVVASASVSATISSILLYAERTLAEGGLSHSQRYMVWAIYLFFAGMDFATLSIGGGHLARSFELEEVMQVESKKDTSSAFLISTKQELAQDLREELRAIKHKINTIESTGVRSTRRVRTLKATLVRCEKKHKPCPDTHAEMRAIVKAQHSKRVAKLEKSRKRIQANLLNITNSYEASSTRINAEKSSKIENIKEESRSLQWWITFFSFIFVLGNLFIARVRSVLSMTMKEEESGELTEDEIRDAYMLAGMKAYATDEEIELLAEDVNNEEMMLNLPRDPVMIRAKKISKGKLRIGGKKAKDTIIRLQSAGMPFRIWLRGQAWNNLYVESA